MEIFVQKGQTLNINYAKYSYNHGSHEIHGFRMLWANVFEATKEPSTMLAGSGKEKRQRMEAALGAE